MMTRTIADKLGVRAGARVYFRNAPEDVVETMGLPPVERARRLTGAFDFLHLFVKTGAAMSREFPRLKQHLAEGGALWVSWPKGPGGKSNLRLPDVIRIGYCHGLVESKVVALGDDWSAMKFTRPRPGVVYANSYGTLPQSSKD